MPIAEGQSGPTAPIQHTITSNKTNHLQAYDWLPPCNRGTEYNHNLSPQRESRVRFMANNQKHKPTGRNQRHSAAWGKRLSLVLLLATGMAFGQRWNNPAAGETGKFVRFSPELSGFLAKAHQGSAQGQTLRVIVQYRQVPTSAHYAAMQGRGAHLHARLHLIKGAAFTIPVSALAALEADPEVASVTIDHAMNVMDDTTNTATGVHSAWSAGFDGTG